MKRPDFVAVALLLALTGCPRVFVSPDAEALAAAHTTIAVVPPTVSIAAVKKVDGDAMQEQQRTESTNFQREIHSWLLKRKMQGRITQEIQSLETTNANLQDAGWPDKALSTEELCRVLGVDGLVTSNFALSKPMSEGAAVAMALLAGAWGATNRVETTVSNTDCKNAKLIWNYDHKLAGSLGTNSAQVVDALMRSASKKLPYAK